ncbi:MAG: N-acetylmuramoyl-L-alanine amidase [Prosthecobacter sp.]
MALLLSLYVLSSPHAALAAERVALVIGNNSYTNLSESRQLGSPVADATDVAAALMALGYVLVNDGPITNVTRDGMTAATESFATQAKGAEAAVFYYSGHGVQVGEDNYLLPSDAPRLTGLSMLKNRAVLLRDSVMVALEEAGVRTKVIILDCCRDNPFSAQIETALAQVGKSIKTKSVGEITGYGPGFYLAFATSPGTLADDGNGERNSPFTAAMLKILPGSASKDIDFLFREVKASLGEAQVSWTSHSLQGSFVLAHTPPAPVPEVSLPQMSATATASAATTPPAPEGSPPDTAEKKTKGWDIQSIGDRHYISAESIRDFYNPLYGFNTFRFKDGNFWLGSSKLILKAQIGSPNILINNIKFVLTFPVLEKTGQVFFSRFDLCTVIDPVLCPSHMQDPEVFDTVVIDAGHGGADEGNKGVHGNEKDFTLSMASVLRAAVMQRGFKVIMTRTTDTTVSLQDRVAIANAVPKSIVISLQHNASSDTTTSGIETFVNTPAESIEDKKSDTVGMSLAAAVHANVISRFKFVDRGLKRPAAALLPGCKRPTVVFEGGFVTNDKECLLIASDTYRQQVSAALADAVVNYRKALSTALKPKPANAEP